MTSNNVGIVDLMHDLYIDEFAFDINFLNWIRLELTNKFQKKNYILPKSIEQNIEDNREIMVIWENSNNDTFKLFIREDKVCRIEYYIDNDTGGCVVDLQNNKNWNTVLDIYKEMFGICQ